MDEQDPALNFFPDGKVDLYGALGLTKDASEEAIKKAYRKLALIHHPDKQKPATASSKDAAAGSSSSETSSGTSSKFQQIGYAYAVLSTPARRARYDTTGRTDESMFEEGMDWNAYFRELWTGEVSADTLDKYRETYRGSKEEREDILEAYRNTKGHLKEMVDHVPFMSLREDRKRVEAVVEAAIKAKDLKRQKQWDVTRKDTKMLAQAEKEEAAEEKEAEEMAKELGVYDALFGDEAAKAKSRANGQGKAKKRKQAEDDDNDDGDLSALQNIIAKRNQNRGNQMDSLIAKLEAEAAAKSGKKKAHSKASAATENGASMPSDDEFARLQAKMDAKRRKAKA